MIRGGGDLGSGVTHRLAVCGFPVVVLETAAPTLVRSSVSFGAAVFTGRAEVEGVVAERCGGPEDVEAARASLARGRVAVLVDPEARSRRTLRPAVLVDAILAKRAGSTRLGDAPLVIALGPGHEAGLDAHVVVETKRGHRLGRVITAGRAAEDTGIPGEVGGAAAERVLRAPAPGPFERAARIGDVVAAGQAVARVGGQPVTARIGGIVRGLLWDGVIAEQGMKVGDIDPRGSAGAMHEISDKARAVAGGVLEAVLRFRTAWDAGARDGQA
jgi:xanthine dehydrogenase accessory factor